MLHVQGTGLPLPHWYGEEAFQSNEEAHDLQISRLRLACVIVDLENITVLAQHFRDKPVSLAVSAWRAKNISPRWSRVFLNQTDDEV